MLFMKFADRAVRYIELSNNINNLIKSLQAETLNRYKLR